MDNTRREALCYKNVFIFFIVLLRFLDFQLNISKAYIPQIDSEHKFHQDEIDTQQFVRAETGSVITITPYSTSN